MSPALPDHKLHTGHGTEDLIMEEITKGKTISDLATTYNKVGITKTGYEN